MYKQSLQFNTTLLFQIIGTGCAIVGVSLIIYSIFKWKRSEKKRELEEFDNASDIKDPKRRRERDSKFNVDPRKSSIRMDDDASIKDLDYRLD